MQWGKPPRRRDPRLPDTPTIYELVDRYKTTEANRRLATVVLGSGPLGRPMAASPGMPPDSLKILRDAFAKTMADPEFLAETKKRRYELEPVSGEEVETLAKEVLAQPVDVIDRMKKLCDSSVTSMSGLVASRLLRPIRLHTRNGCHRGLSASVRKVSNRACGL